MRCERCFKETNCTIMSMFNTEILCLECKEKEKTHPRYAQAVEAEHSEVVKGNYTFGGIGWY